MPAGQHALCVAGDPLPLEEDLHHRGRDAGIHRFPFQLIGHAVVVVFYLHMVVDVHLVLLPRRILVPPLRQGFHGGLVYGLEEVPPRYLQLL
ncbi:MAG: hypothetical protein A4E58_01548 [Syntrophorhabdus sp. PtaB.Bin006]|nr:MAG: hypothetical protein A4E58_01548 [Syntrophorhabdus sp. PtaB.Bin006]